MSREHRPVFRRPVILIAIAVLACTSSLSANDPLPMVLVDTEGHEVDYPSLIEGRPALLVFWATWCGPCRAEIPRIAEAHRRFGGDGLAVLAIDPGIRDNLTNFKLYAEHFGLSYPVYFDTARAARERFHLIGTPTVVLLDADGREVSRSDTVDFDAVERLMKR